MPLINGCKYSCEPCIRGHRATSCAHTDRILIEVRKPGRPLESCGHNLNTCQCGRVAELFQMGDVLPSPAPSLQQLGAEPDMSFIVTTPPPALSAPKTRRQSSSKSRVSKKSSSRRKVDASAGSTSSPNSRNRGSRETSTLTDDNEAYDTSTTTSSPGIQDPGYDFQQLQQPGQYLPSMGGPNYPPMQLRNEYMQYQSHPPGMQYVYAPPQQQYQYESGPQSYSSRIEDVTGRPKEGQVDGKTEVRSQYIVATQDSVWKAAP